MDYRDDYRDIIKNVLNKQWEINFNESKNGNIYFNISGDNCKDIEVTISIINDLTPFCVIYLKYPFTIDETYNDLILEKINYVNNKFVFGNYNYEKEENIISCKYAFPCSDYETEFKENFKFILLQLLSYFDDNSKFFF